VRLVDEDENVIAGVQASVAGLGADAVRMRPALKERNPGPGDKLSFPA
jgi:hypothetical protein